MEYYMLYASFEKYDVIALFSAHYFRSYDHGISQWQMLYV